MARCARYTWRRLAGCSRSCRVVAALGCCGCRCGSGLTVFARAACTRRSCAGRMRKPAPAATAASARRAPGCPFRQTLDPNWRLGLGIPRNALFTGRSVAPAPLAAFPRRSRVARGQRRPPAPRSVGFVGSGPNPRASPHGTAWRAQFAHGQDELRPVMRHPRYKTEVRRLRSFHAPPGGCALRVPTQLRIAALLTRIGGRSCAAPSPPAAPARTAPAAGSSTTAARRRCPLPHLALAVQS